MAQAPQTISAATKLVVASWMALCATGMWQLSEHAAGPGASGPVMTKMTNELATQLHWSREQSLLVVVAHPQCPCLAASLDELDAVLAKNPTISVRILAFEPSVRPPEWDRSARQLLFGDLQNGTVVVDRDGELAAKFGATTSGHVSLFQPNGELTFAGGITGSRGHRGDNENRRALQQALSSPTGIPSRTLVYGCPLQSPCDCPQ